MPRIPPPRDIVAATPYRPPAAPATRKGGLRPGRLLVTTGLVAGVAVVVAAAALDPGPATVSVRAPAPAAAPAPDARLVLAGGRATLVREGVVAWRGRGPVDCVTGAAWRGAGDAATLVSQACVRLRDGALVALAGRVPDGATVVSR
jgi:hypothetical protein